MTKSTETWLKQLEDDAAGLDKAYARYAHQLPVKRSVARYSGTGAGPEYGNRRILITFNTDTGANTLASLGLSGDETSIQSVARKPYDGGAQWAVLFYKMGSDDKQVAVNFNIEVMSLIAGSITITEAWHGY